ncbi:hypothetical protein [Actinoallomurus sp. NPDC050550]|uniref:hypothetical protein n=1 Tax=Actinoallomurus sp. NPDC050550 TaxID=3154937 RepID=UPI0033DE0E19
MSEQPPSVLFEAVRLVDTLRRKWNAGSAPKDDVWSEATSEAWSEHTGAAECRYCPVCRAIAASRESGPEVLSHVMAAGEQLYSAVREAMAGFERTRPRPRAAGDDPAGAGTATG